MNTPCDNIFGIGICVHLVFIEFEHVLEIDFHRSDNFDKISHFDLMQAQKEHNMNFSGDIKLI